MKIHNWRIGGVLIGVLAVLSSPSTVFSQKEPINIFEQNGVGVLVVKSKYPYDMYVGVDGNWQGIVPAGATVYMPVEGFVTRDSGFDAEGNLNIKHAYGGFRVRPNMQINMRPRDLLSIRDWKTGKDVKIAMETVRSLPSSDVDKQGRLRFVLGDPPHVISEIELERMQKMPEGRPPADWTYSAKKLGDARVLSTEDAARFLNLKLSPDEKITVFGFPNPTATISPKNGTTYTNNKIEINGIVQGMLDGEVLQLKIGSKLNTLKPVLSRQPNGDVVYAFLVDADWGPNTAVLSVGREGTTMTHLIETQFTCQQPAQPVISTPMYLPDDPVHFHSQPDIENNTPNPSLGETFREAVERGLAPYRNQSIPDTEGKEGVSAPVDFDHSGRGDATRR